MSNPTRVSVETLTIPAARIGADNPLPLVDDVSEPPYEVQGDIPADMLDRMSYGSVRSMYPYLLQDGYDRTLEPREFTTVVLENDNLRARIMPELGGRVWSLFDKQRGVELLHENSVVQYGNLALRNAWFAGGIEWNLGTRGHAVSSASPLHTALVEAEDGSTSVRMWEFDRVRELVFQVDIWLPESSPVLLVSIRLHNPNDHDVPVYWWSNAAIPQSDALRVVAPAETAYATGYDGGMLHLAVSETELTPSRNSRAVDYFIDIPETERPWIAGADELGNGLAIVSTERLRGRKLFCWGESAGGHRWQQWLTPDGRHYAEIQSGLAKTQFEHLRMPARTTWEWVEAYGNIALDSESATASHAELTAAASARVNELWSTDAATDALAEAVSRADLPPSRTIIAGHGWGALERRVRELSGIDGFVNAGIPFDDASLCEEQDAWVNLLENGALPDGSPSDGVPSYVSGEFWETALAAAPQTWIVAFHRATMAHARGDLEVAAELYSVSLALEPSALAHRGLAKIHGARGEHKDAADRYLHAVELAPGERSLLIEAVGALRAAGNPGGAVELIGRMPSAARARGRIRFLEASALHDVGRKADARAILDEGIEIPDLREGEESMSDLWARVCPGEPLPVEYDFRMKASGK